MIFITVSLIDAAQLSRGRSQKQRIANYATPLESIQAKVEPVDTEDDVP